MSTLIAAAMLAPLRAGFLTGCVFLAIACALFLSGIAPTNSLSSIAVSVVVMLSLPSCGVVSGALLDATITPRAFYRVEILRNVAFACAMACFLSPTIFPEFLSQAAQAAMASGTASIAFLVSALSTIALVSSAVALSILLTILACELPIRFLFVGRAINAEFPFAQLRFLLTILLLSMFAQMIAQFSLHLLTATNQHGTL